VIYGALAGYLLSFGDKNTSVINGSWLSKFNCL
jgi:hypothetical protein